MSLNSGIERASAINVALPFGRILPRPIIPEVQAVLDRLTDVTGDEADAIATYIVAMVNDGTYGKVHEIWAPALNSPTDAQIGWKIYGLGLLLNIGTVNHNPGEGYDFTTASAKLLSPLWNAVAITPNRTGAFAYVSDPNAVWPANADVDYMGITGGTGDLAYLRSRRGNANSYDNDLVLNHTGITPRPPTTGAPLIDDMIGMFQAADNQITLLAPGDDKRTVGRTDGVRTDIRWAWNGSNSGGIDNAIAIRHSLWMFTDSATAADVTLLRLRSLQFLTQLGVTGVPVP